jgi:hypothetical protein
LNLYGKLDTEEVGILARMSGQASSDINEMLAASQNQVRLIAETKIKIIKKYFAMFS